MNMHNRHFVRGLFIMLIALVFGGAAFRYPIGKLSHSGPGLFPLMISGVLLVIGLITVIRARFTAPEPLNYSFRNIIIIMVSLCGFVLVSELTNMLLGICFMVFVSTLAGTSYSVIRNVKISAGLCAVAFGFKSLLGLSLPLL